MISRYVLSRDKSEFADIQKQILDETNNERLNMVMEIGKHHVSDFNDLFVELILSDSDAGMRAIAFWVLCILGEEDIAEDLLEVIDTEEVLDAKISMIDSFKDFATVHKISVDNIYVDYMERGDRSPLLVRSQSQNVNISEIPEQDAELLDKDVAKVDERIVQISEAKTRLKRLLLELSPNIPITLTRMAEVAGVTTESLDRYLKEITKTNNAGIYYPLEQVFVKQERTIERVLGPIARNEPTCIDCGAISFKYPCSECGKGQQCSVCKLNLGDGEERIGCPSCDTPAHAKHLQEWVRIKGTCPNCREKVKLGF